MAEGDGQSLHLHKGSCNLPAPLLQRQLLLQTWHSAAAFHSADQLVTSASCQRVAWIALCGIWYSWCWQVRKFRIVNTSTQEANFEVDRKLLERAGFSCNQDKPIKLVGAPEHQSVEVALTLQVGVADAASCLLQKHQPQGACAACCALTARRCQSYITIKPTSSPSAR